MAFPGGSGSGMPPLGPFSRPSGGGAQPADYNSLSPEQQQMVMVKQMQAAMESCPIKTVISGGMGFALGGVFGLFMASMSYDTMYTATGQPSKILDMPWRQQLKLGLKDMGSRSYSSAKGFGMVGALYSGTECVIESYRAKNDMANAILAGCATGGILGASGGPQAAAIGCAGFAAFSTAIEYYLRSD